VGVLLFFLFGVVGISPWYDAQYFIPLAGMIVGNALTGVSLALSQMNQQMHEKQAQVEEVLILGGTLSEATKAIVDQSFSEAIVPTLNTMVGMGIVFLPGMMTGQILSGVSPLLAIRYQIAIMLGILGSVSLSVFFVLYFGIKTYFNDQIQIKK
jgi:putative ABC transport system permease protein